MISNGTSASKVRQASQAFLPGNDASFANPMASTACLFSILIVMIGTMQAWGIWAPVAGFQAELPPPSTEPHQILVNVTKSDQITIDGRSTNKVRVYSDIATAISAHKRLGESTLIALTADKDSKWEVAITVRDAAREAGDDDFAFGWRQ